MAPARLNAVRPNPERRRIPPAGVAAPSPSSLEPGIADLVRLQREAGNAAVVTLLQRQPSGPGEIPGEVAGTPAAGASTVETPERRTLRFGSTGEDVKLLQMKLRHLRERMHDRPQGGNSRIDGIFGPLTRLDVLDFQTDTGLVADGIVGMRTWSALDELVPETPTEEGERAEDARSREAEDLATQRQYDAALVIIEDLLAGALAPEDEAALNAAAARCHHQRGRFAVAVGRYEQALRGRFNQETRRARILDELLRARANVFLDAPEPDPEPVPEGAEGPQDGGGITPHEPVRAGDTGPAADLFKGKLAHVMSGWRPSITDGDQIDARAVEITRRFQQSSGLPQTGEGDAATWHALDSFSPRDVPNSALAHFTPRRDAAIETSQADPAAAIPLWEALAADFTALGLVENARLYTFRAGHDHHRLSRFDEALERYQPYLERVIPDPTLYTFVLESIRLARAHEPAPD